MTQDLYALLGIARDSNATAVRAAYRRLSKIFHPDAPNGNAEHFQALKRGHDILIDPARRKRYDETGRADDVEADQGRGPALATIAGALEQVLAQAEKSGHDPLQIDIVASMDNFLAQQKQAIARRRDAVNTRLASYKKIRQRFGHDKGEQANVLEMLVRNRLTHFELELADLARQTKVIAEAAKIMKGHTFRMDIIKDIGMYVTINNATWG
jgi:curved DNA-binding protein CbpA